LPFGPLHSGFWEASGDNPHEHAGFRQKLNNPLDGNAQPRRDAFGMGRLVRHPQPWRLPRGHEQHISINHRL
jgi:hypothetical protein